MKKNGFTLVELLAVIVILGLLFVFIIPKVNSFIKSSRVEAANQSINNLVKSLNSLAIDKKTTLTSFDGCSMNFDNSENTCDDLEFSGKLPTSGSISVDKDGYVIGGVRYEEDVFEIRNNQVFNINKGFEYTFDYTGDEQIFLILTDGYYKLESWGAQGGNGRKAARYGIGGYGGYSTGVVSLNDSATLYINVGGVGGDGFNVSSCIGSPSGYCLGGYNGGGNSVYNSDEKWGAGGGATHIALKSGLLSTLSSDVDKILIVSGGGGGAYSTRVGGSAGGYIGNNGYLRDGYTQSIGGSQLAGGDGSRVGSFGLGGFGSGKNAAGGGAGFYGAGSGTASAAGGGSGYIGNSLLTNKYMVCFSCQESDDETTKTISVSDENKVTEAPISGNPKKGNGFVKITYLGKSID